MAIALICPDRDMSQWAAAFHQLNPAIEVQIWPDIHTPEAIDYAVVWKHHVGLWQSLPNLRCISSLGAGVDWLLRDPELPVDMPIVRIVDDDLKQSMAEYVCYGALHFFRKMNAYCQQQARKEWRMLPLPHISMMPVGILGYGELGRYVGGRLEQLGFPVRGYRRSAHDGQDADSVGHSSLAEFVTDVSILVCLLPLTSETKGILNLELLSKLPMGSCLINVARGEHLVEQDLLTALDCGRLSWAMLDVACEEPLTVSHPFWSHPKICITPHCAAITNPYSAVQQILENYTCMHNKKPLLNQVDRSRGY